MVFSGTHQVVDFRYWIHRLRHGLVGLVLGVFAGCAVTPAGRGGPPAVYVPDAEQRTLIREDAVHDEISEKGKAIYNLLAAEMAGQAGDLEAALDFYMAAIRHTEDSRVIERAAQLALFVDDRERALEAVTLWLQRDPDNPAAHKTAALLYLKLGRIEEGVQNLARVLAGAGAASEEDVSDVGRFLSREVSRENGFRALERLVQMHGDKAAVRYVYAWLAAHYRRNELALAQVDHALRISPRWQAARLLKAQVQFNAEDPIGARVTLRRAIEADPGNSQLRMAYTQFLLNGGDVAGAERELKRLLQRDAGNEDAKFMLGMIYLQSRRDDEAYQAFLPLLESPKWQTQAAYQLGRIAFRRQDWEQSVEWFDQAAEGTQSLDPQFSAVLALSELQRTDEAMARLDDLLAQFPDDAVQIYLLRAEVLSSAKNYRRAFDELTTALARFPEDDDLLYTRALTAEKLNRLDVLESDLRAILKRQPDNASALNALGYTLIDRTDRLEEGARLLEQAMRLKSEEPAILDSYGWLKFRQGNMAAAEKYLRRAYAASKDLEIAAHLGEVLWATGRRREALRTWRAALRAQPDHDYATRLHRRMKELGL